MDASRRTSRRSKSRRSSRKTSSSSSPRSSRSTSGRTSDSDRRHSERRSDDANHQKNLVLLKLPHEQDPEGHQPEDRRSTMRQGTERRSRRCSCGVGTDSGRQTRDTLDKRIVRVPVPPGRRGDSILLPKDSVYRDSLSRLMEREQIDRTHYKASRDPRSARETIGDVWEDDYYPDKRRRRSSYLRSKKYADKSRWITWAISRSLPDTKRFVMVCLRELLIFSIFLFVFTWVALGALHHHRNIYCHVVMNVLTKTLYSTNQSIDAVTTTTSTYYSIKTVQDIWTYLSEHFVNVLYFYNIEDRISLQIPKLDSEKVLYENIVVGPARLRQVRVRNDSCIVPEMFRTWFNECYNYYYNMYEDTGSYGPGYAPQWAWQSTVDVTSYTGKVSTYSPNGYFLDMKKKFYAENSTMRELQTSGWIDRATRALLLEFVAYTPNTNLFAVIKLVMELPPGGGVIPTASCYSMQLISFVGLLDIFNLIFAILALLFAIYFFIVLMKDLKYFGWPYFFTFWGMLDLTIIILLILLIIIAVIRELAVHIKLPGLVKNIDDDKYGSFDMLALTQKLFYGILGVILVLCWIKVIKFFAMCTTIAVLFIAIGKSKLRLMALTLIGFILLIGFSLGAHLFFGVYIEEFSSVGNSIFTLLTIPVGGLYFYEELNYYRPILAPIFLSLFIFVFILLLLSLFVAVLVYGFERAEEKRILTAPKRKYGFYEYILRLGVVMFNKCKCRKVSRKLEQKEQSIELKKDHELIISILARHGLRGEEMKLFLLKHGISEHSEATEDQLAKMYKDLKTKQLLEKEVATHNKLQDEIESLQKKLDEMQQQAIHLSAKPTIDQR